MLCCAKKCAYLAMSVCVVWIGIGRGLLQKECMWERRQDGRERVKNRKILYSTDEIF